MFNKTPPLIIQTLMMKKTFMKLNVSSRRAPLKKTTSANK